jgi:hypothetical protein
VWKLRTEMLNSEMLNANPLQQVGTAKGNAMKAGAHPYFALILQLAGAN